MLYLLCHVEETENIPNNLALFCVFTENMKKKPLLNFLLTVNVHDYEAMWA